MTRTFPRLYAIADAELLSRAQIPIENFVRELYAAGVRWLQYRDKTAGAGTVLSRVRGLRESMPADLALFVNDRADVCVMAGCDGVHIGQDDLSAWGVRRVIGSHLFGISTHNETQIEAAAQTEADYVAIGPVFATSSKANPGPVIGTDGVRAARRRTAKPLVGIGGITHRNARSVMEAGADAIAVISGLIPSSRGESPGKLAEDFLALLL